MLSLKPPRRGARGSIGGSGVSTRAEDDDQDSGRGGSTARAESKQVREKPWQSSTKKAFLRNFIVTSKGKLSGRRGDISIGGEGGRDAERAPSSSTVSETSLRLTFSPPHMVLFLCPLDPVRNIGMHTSYSLQKTLDCM